MPSKAELKIITVHLPEGYIKGLDQLVEAKLYPNRSEAIRVAVRDLLRKELWEMPRRLEPVKMYG
ncbi:MAG: transcriptional regulator [Thermoprotei archaeon]|nr:MAG: transcriptional regulator [Thermoprotei archaeon]